MTGISANSQSFKVYVPAGEWRLAQDPRPASTPATMKITTIPSSSTASDFCANLPGPSPQRCRIVNNVITATAAKACLDNVRVVIPSGIETSGADDVSVGA